MIASSEGSPPHTAWVRRAVAAQVVAVAVLFALSDIVGAIDARGHYTPFSGAKAISATVWDETVQYAPSARRFMRTGSLFSGDVKESGQFDSVQPIVPTIVIGGLGWISSSLEWTWIVLHGLLPALAWLLVFLLARSYAGSASLASAVAWGTTLVPFGAREIFLFGLNPFQQPLELSRMPHPALSFPLFLAAALAVAGAVPKADRRRWALAAFLCGGLAYVYFYYWIAALAGLGLLVVLGLVFRERRLLVSALAVSVGALVVSAPYVYLSLATNQGAVLDRNTATNAHYSNPKNVALMLALLVVLGGYAVWRRRSPDRWTSLVLLAFLAGAGLGLNMQIVTGIDIVHDHFLLRVIKPLGFLVAALACAWGFGRVVRNERWRMLAAAAVILPLVGLGAVRQYRVAVRTLPAHRTTSPRVSLLLWLRDHASATAVVGTTDRELIADVPAIAGNYLFVPDGGKTRVSAAEIVRRYLIAAKLQGESLGQVEDDLRDRPIPDGQHQFVNISYLLRVDDLTGQARKLWPTIELRRDLRTRELDYLLTTAGHLPAPVRRVYPDARRIRSAGPWSLIELGALT